MKMITVREIARLLKLKRDNNNSVILVLGARAGRLFRNQTFYQTIRPWSPRFSTFENLSDVEKFHECYQVLSQQTEPTVHDFLSISLQANPRYRQEDMYLVDLVTKKYFDMIISTNIDDFVESALEHEGLRESHDYQVFNPQIHTVKRDMQQRSEYCTLVKVFGDFGSRRYVSRLKDRGPNLDGNDEFKGFLGNTLAKTILVVGYDPLWDRSLERIFPLRGGDFRYVDEEPPVDDSHLLEVIEKRGGQGLIGGYTSFIQVLHAELLDRDPFGRGKNLQGRASLNTAQVFSDLPTQASQELLEFPAKSKETPGVVPPATKRDQISKSNSLSTNSEKRKRVFISYSHKDARYRERLHTYLAIYEREGLLDVWDDKKIKAGANWREEVKRELEEAKVAVLLVSQDFLASKFIAENELPLLLADAKVGGTRIIPVVVNHSTLDDSPLHQFQAVNDPSKPLSTMKAHERDAIWVQVARIIRDA